MPRKASKMITLDEIINTNLNVLESQEAELMHMLQFVKKAKKVFKGNSPSTSRAATARRKTRRSKAGVARPTRKKATAGKSTRKTRRNSTVKSNPGGKQAKRGKVKAGTHLATIVDILKKRDGKAASGEVIQTMFKRQKKDKNYNHFRQLIYPVLTRAYKSGTLVLKNGKIHVPS